jgi:hypothetical protein
MAGIKDFSIQGQMVYFQYDRPQTADEEVAVRVIDGIIARRGFFAGFDGNISTFNFKVNIPTAKELTTEFFNAGVLDQAIKQRVEAAIAKIELRSLRDDHGDELDKYGFPKK